MIRARPEMVIRRPWTFLQISPGTDAGEPEVLGARLFELFSPLEIRGWIR